MARAVDVTLLVPAVLRADCGGAAELAVVAPDVRALLAELERRHPSLHRSLCDESGALRRHVGLFVNRSHVRDREGLETTLAQGDIVAIFPAVSGG